MGLSEIRLSLLFVDLWTVLRHAEIFNRFEVVHTTKASIAGVLFVSVGSLKSCTSNSCAMRWSFLNNSGIFIFFRDRSGFSPEGIPLVLVEHSLSD